MKKIFCTVMLALAMSAGVSAENAANGAVGNANGKTAESKYVPTLQYARYRRVDNDKQRP